MKKIILEKYFSRLEAFSICFLGVSFGLGKGVFISSIAYIIVVIIATVYQTKNR